MQGSDVYYRPITFADYDEFYPHIPLPRTVKGVAFIKDDEAVGIAGIQHNGCYFTVFSFYSMEPG